MILRYLWGAKFRGKIIQPRYDYIVTHTQDFSVMMVKLNNKWGIVDKEGKVLVDFTDTIQWTAGVNIAWMKVNGTWACYDLNSGVVLAMIYTEFNGVSNVVTNRSRDVVWPKNFVQLKTENEEKQKIAESKACDRFYNGRSIGFKPAGWVYFGSVLNAVVLGKGNGNVSIKIVDTNFSDDYGKTLELPCISDQLR